MHENLHIGNAVAPRASNRIRIDTGIRVRTYCTAPVSYGGLVAPLTVRVTVRGDQYVRVPYYGGHGRIRVLRNLVAILGFFFAKQAV